MHKLVPAPSLRQNWGNRPWTIEFHVEPKPLPKSVEIAIVGGGFTGLAAAAWVRHLAPDTTVALFEAGAFGAGSSGHTGGLALAETAAGDLPGLGDVLAGLSRILRDLDVSGDLLLPGVWEIEHGKPARNSPISWTDSGSLAVMREVPGGTVDPGKLISGLARSAARKGALLFEGAPVEDVQFGQAASLHVQGKEVLANKVLFATNAASLELNGLAGSAEPKFTLALATEPLTEEALLEIGLASGKPFYTNDLPYLWGRLLHGNSVMFGAGLVHLQDWRDLRSIDVEVGEAASSLGSLERRVHCLHPALRDVRIDHRWGGPILIGEGWMPVFRQHPGSSNAIVLGAYSGHGVALSVYLGAWAAEVFLGKRALPNWNS